MRNIYIIGAALLLSGCRSKTSTIVEYRDSIRTEVVERVVLVPDTVEVEIEREVERVIVRDTVSDLRNRYAKSRAQVLPDGFLLHTLESIPQTITVERPQKIIYKDSIVYKDKYVDREVVREKKTPLLEKIGMALFWAAVGAVVSWILTRRRT